MSKLWGGRYTGVTDALMWDFNASIGFDRHLAQYDIQGSVAYAAALGKVGVLTADEVDALADGLRRVADEFERGVFQFAENDEDIHTAVERRLSELVGAVSGKLHTGRSRNDQVATDVRLYMMAALADLRTALSAAMRSIVSKAEAHLGDIMPGYTHLQPAQPVLVSHWLMSFFWMLSRDLERLDDLYERVAVCPLGSGPLAGNAFGIDRDALAQALGFRGVSDNSMDAVSDRDMIVETLSWAAQIGLHLSRLAEDLVIYSSREFGFVTLAERYTTGSSIMPQKRNPDSMELVRGKTGRLVGNLTRMLVVAKGIPSTYDKDLQEDKEPLFDSLDTLAMLLPITAGVVESMQVNADAMRASLDEAMLATDLADYLVKRGVPFREAHHHVGRAVLLSEQKAVTLSQLTLDDYQSISPAYGADLYDVLDFEYSVNARSVRGGTGRSAVEAQIARARALLAD